jgi:DNA replication protein
MDTTRYAAIDMNHLLLENYKKIGITETELVVLIMIDHLLKQGNTFITQELLALKMTLSVQDIDRVFTNLLSKKLVEFDSINGQMTTTLNPLKERLYREFEIEFLKQRDQSLERDFDEQIQNIYAVFEKELKRTLSPAEFQKIREWISLGYSEEVIIDALQEALSLNKRSIRSIDKILLKRTTRADIKKEGYTTVSESWNKDIEKTIAIASEKWVEDDEE